MTDKDDITKVTRTDINNMIYMPVPEHEDWKVNILVELINVKWDEAVIEGFDAQQIDNIIDDICTS